MRVVRHKGIREGKKVSAKLVLFIASVTLALSPSFLTFPGIPAKEQKEAGFNVASSTGQATHQGGREEHSS
jgi:hypothetical protein